MEPSKIEKQFREQLYEREIKPSQTAWNRLDAMLDVAEKKRIKFPWVAVAASFLGIMLIGTVYFNGFRAVELNKDTPVVAQERTFEEPEMINTAVVSNLIHEKTVNTTKVVADNKNLKKQPKQLGNNDGNKSNISPYKGNDAVVVSIEKNKYESIIKNKYVSAEELLAEVSATKFEQKATDKTHEKIKKGTVSVNPSSLLSTAETELNQTFRESALDKLNKKFNAVKTVLANRNYEE